MGGSVDPGNQSSCKNKERRKKKIRAMPSTSQLAEFPLDEDEVLSGLCYDHVSPALREEIEHLDGIGNLACIMLHADVLTAVAQLLVKTRPACTRMMDSALLSEVFAKVIVNSWAASGLM